MKRLTKDDLPTTLGAFNPVGYVMVGVASADALAPAHQAFRDAGFAEDDILEFQPATGEALSEMADHASPVSAFGFEIVQMKRYIALSREGYRWLLVFAPDDAGTERVKQVLARIGAKVAVKYHRLANEDLV